MSQFFGLGLLHRLELREPRGRRDEPIQLLYLAPVAIALRTYPREILTQLGQMLALEPIIAEGDLLPRYLVIEPRALGFEGGRGRRLLALGLGGFDLLGECAVSPAKFLHFTVKSGQRSP